MFIPTLYHFEISPTFYKPWIKIIFEILFLHLILIFIFVQPPWSWKTQWAFYSYSYHSIRIVLPKKTRKVHLQSGSSDAWCLQVCIECFVQLQLWGEIFLQAPGKKRCTEKWMSCASKSSYLNMHEKRISALILVWVRYHSRGFLMRFWNE